MNDAQHHHGLGKVEGMLVVLIKDNEKAREDRKALYVRVESVERSQERIERKIDAQDRRLKSVEEPIENFSKWRERFIGMTMVWTIIAGGVGSAVTYYWQKIVAMLTG